MRIHLKIQKDSTKANGDWNKLTTTNKLSCPMILKLQLWSMVKEKMIIGDMKAQTPTQLLISKRKKDPTVCKLGTTLPEML